MKHANAKYGLEDSKNERFSFAAGRRKMCKSVGLSPSASGCTEELRKAGWDKGSKDEAIDILCTAGILGGVDCEYFQAGGELKNGESGGINLGMLFLGLFILMALIIGVYFLIKKFRKK